MQSPEPSTESVDHRAPADSRPTSLWIRQHYAHITMTIGGLLLFLAILTPFIAPPEQRGTVAIITVLFGFTAALLLFVAVTANKSRAPGIVMHARGDLSARAQLADQVARRARLRAVIGLGFGLLLVVSGLIAPFALSAGDANANADARFLMVLGFAPVALSGGLIGFVFWRNLRARPIDADSVSAPHHDHSGIHSDSITTSFSSVAVASGGLLLLCAALMLVLSIQSANADTAATTVGIGGTGLVLMLAGYVISRRSRTTTVHGTEKTRRAPVARVPINTFYRKLVPLAIAIIFILIALVIGVVFVATLTPLMK